MSEYITRTIVTSTTATLTAVSYNKDKIITGDLISVTLPGNPNDKAIIKEAEKQHGKANYNIVKYDQVQETRRMTLEAFIKSSEVIKE